jgi:hypothetical protein
MATQLETVSGLSVLSMLWAPNQARILRAFHATTVDSSSFLPEGTQVTYTDPDLGLCFVGKITDYKKAYRNGEGVEYQCADGYRTLTKTPAAILVNGVKETRLSFVTGTSIQDIITKIFNGSGVATYLTGGLYFGITDADTPAVDKGGQSVDTWLQDLLDCTPGGIAWVNPNSGYPQLDITDFTTAPSVTLQVGTFSIINPVSGNPILEGGDIGKSLNRKYQKVMVQGCGWYKRHELEWLPGELFSSNETAGEYEYRFYIPGTPGKRIVCRYIDDDGNCQDGCKVRVALGFDPDDIVISRTVFDFDNPSFKTDDQGRLYYTVIVRVVTYFGAVADAGPPAVQVWVTYTSEEGPFVKEITSTDPKLAGEGSFIEQHDEFVKYEGPNGTIDQTALLEAVANALAARYCDAADLTGTLGVHLDALYPEIQLGSPVTNFSNARVQTVEYDFMRRSMNLAISTVPLRENIKKAKQDTKDGTLEGGNWYQPRVKYTNNCFCEGGVNSVDENGNASGGPGSGPWIGGPGGGPGNNPKGKSWDCNKMMMPWTCDERPDALGMFMNLGDCNAVCKEPMLSWKFVKCVGCVAAQGMADGQYETKDACLAEHAPGSDYFFNLCKYTCDRNLGCIGGTTGTYATKLDCENNCKQTGSGYGSGGVVGSPRSAPPGPGSGSGGRSFGCPCSMALKGISIGEDGTVKGVSFGVVNPPQASAGSAGYCYGEKQSVTLLKDININGDGTWTKTFVTLTYCGDAPSETTSTESCDCGGY